MSLNVLYSFVPLFWGWINSPYLHPHLQTADILKLSESNRETFMFLVMWCFFGGKHFPGSLERRHALIFFTRSGSQLCDASHTPVSESNRRVIPRTHMAFVRYTVPLRSWPWQCRGRRRSALLSRIPCHFHIRSKWTPNDKKETWVT